MKIIVGLGNPGRQYERTPHNIGFEIIDEMAREHRAALRKSWRFPLESAQIRIGNEEVLLVKPHTFMNRSGEAVAPLLRKKGVGPDALLVIVDDIALPLGSLRLRARGSAGTHNGLASMIERVGTADFARLRVGVGPVPPGQDWVAFVLGKFPAACAPELEALNEKARAAIAGWVVEGVEKTMNKFNG